MDPLLYKVIHLAGVMAVFMGLGISLVPESAFRKPGAMFHGIGLILILIAGFGLIAKLKLGFPGWVMVKLVIWFALGALPALAKRKVVPICAAWIIAVVLGFGAAYLGVYKPF
ncbi:MAG: hypothetical protein ACI8T1_001917 [Verrucomicrobiales bacterium]|jgi:hypothetical protein